ncbi:MAG TPA: hypothetical protein VK909_00475 [Anaerolineales bacterium]|nr:hypothetical protein [Anaerolineales bacterium]
MDRFVQDLYIIQINGFSALMDDSHKMIAWRQLRGTPREVEGLFVEAIGLIVDDHRHRPETEFRQAVFLAQGWFRQRGVISSRPPALTRVLARRITQTVRRHLTSFRS